jgi:hypothetical protein
MAKLRADTALLKIESEKAARATKEQRIEAEKIDAQYKKNTESIRNHDRQMSGSTTLVGEYERGFTGAFKNMCTSILAMSGLVAGAIGAFKMLNSAIQENEGLSEFLERKVGGLSSSFDVLKGKVLGFFESLLTSNDEKSIKWGNGLRHVLGVLTTGFSELIPGVRKLGDEMNDAAKANEEIIKKQQELQDLEGERILQRSIANKALAEAKLAVNDLNVTEAEKAKGLRDALKIENEILQEEIEHQKKVIENQKAINELKKTAGLYDKGREGLALAREEAKLNDLQTESFVRQRKAESTANRQESLELKKKLDDDLMSWRVYFDEKGRLISEQVRDVEFFGSEQMLTGKGAQVTGAKSDIRKDNEVGFQKWRLNESKKYANLIKQAEIQSAEEAAEQKKEINAAYLSAVGGLLNSYSSLLESNKQKELSSAGDNAKKREAIEREYRKKQQQAAYLQAIINAAQGITAIWARWAWNPIVAGILTGIEAAATGIQLKVIASQKFAKGGLLVGRSHEQGGIPIRVNGQPGYEAEGGEAIINKRSTAKYRNLLSKINQEGGGKKFAMGGLLPEQSNAVGFDLNLMSNLIANQINSIQVINNVGEFNKANGLYAKINTRQKV